jgi:Holliday junction resolvase RusA-like endonuclease
LPGDPLAVIMISHPQARESRGSSDPHAKDKSRRAAQVSYLLRVAGLRVAQRVIGDGCLEFFIPGNPSGKGRSRFARQGQFVRTYTPRETEAYESNIRLFAAEAMNGSPPTEGPVAIAIKAVFGIPVSWHAKKRADPPAHTVRPDGDNPLKSALDGMAGVVFLDDKQVYRLSVEKSYGDRPGLWIKAEVQA